MKKAENARSSKLERIDVHGRKDNLGDNLDRSLFRQLDDGVLYFSFGGEILAHNASCVEITGIPEKELNSGNIFDLAKRHLSQR